MRLSKKMSDIYCNCGYCFTGHTNLFGKICPKCGEYIAPEQELSIVKDNKQKKEKIDQELKEYLARKQCQ